MITAEISTQLNATSGWLLVLVAGSIVTSLATLLKSRNDNQRTKVETENLAQQTTNAALTSYRAYADPVIEQLKAQIVELKSQMAELQERVVKAENRTAELEQERQDRHRQDGHGDHNGH